MTAFSVELAFNRLPILAEALEDTRCDQQDILSHFRGPGPHTRGCWALDLGLGKEWAMTEEEWLACSDPEAMLEFLREHSQRQEAAVACRGVLPAQPGSFPIRLEP